MSQDQTIRVSAGAVEYTYPRTITATSDISGDAVQVSLGSYDAPTTWGAPTVISHPTTSSVVVQLIVSTIPDPTRSRYWLWTRVTDTPEVVPRRTPGRITIL